MNEILDFISEHVEQFRRLGQIWRCMSSTKITSKRRLPSLYSDFTVQQHTNPDGYAANVAAWEEGLQKAAKAGLISASGDRRDTLSLSPGEDLLRLLETKEWGRPLALKTVIVGESLLSASHHNSNSFSLDCRMKR